METQMQRKSIKKAQKVQLVLSIFKLIYMQNYRFHFFRQGLKRETPISGRSSDWKVWFVFFVSESM